MNKITTVMHHDYRFLGLVLIALCSGCARSDAPTYHLFTSSLDASTIEVDMAEDLPPDLSMDMSMELDMDMTPTPMQDQNIPGCDEEEVCDGEDNDCDGEIDEGVLNPCGACGNLPLEVCDGEDNDCDGDIDEGLINACGMCGVAPVELCDGNDNDCDGEVDEGARNACGFCGALPEEVCDLVDNDCDGVIDEQGCVTAELNFDGDCMTVSCPPEAPYPIACQVDFQGDDSRGCVAHRPGESSVFLKEGRICNAGRVVGNLTCSSIQAGVLDATTCPINKVDAFYPADRGDCPD